MTRRASYCSFFSSLCSLYWRRNPDHLTSEQFLDHLNPVLINNCQNLNLLINTLEKKIIMLLQPRIYQLEMEAYRYDHSISMSCTFYRTSSEWLSLESAPERLRKSKEQLKNLQVTLSNIERTGYVTSSQRDLLDSFVKDFVPRGTGAVSPILLLYKRLLQLTPDLDNSARMAGVV